MHLSGQQQLKRQDCRPPLNRWTQLVWQFGRSLMKIL
jgi:hypothetical protein